MQEKDPGNCYVARVDSLEVQANVHYPMDVGDLISLAGSKCRE
ncbi:MAG: hypothetical protein OXC80_03695 [Gammaproteobacteria bacterium]|nr:hypothetical protein [Gammaproteobacteria bacterium]